MYHASTSYRIAAGLLSFNHISRVARSLFNLPTIWARRASRRNELRELMQHDNRIFSDVGLRREDVAREAFKSFWRR